MWRTAALQLCGIASFNRLIISPKLHMLQPGRSIGATHPWRILRSFCDPGLTSDSVKLPHHRLGGLMPVEACANKLSRCRAQTSREDLIRQDGNRCFRQFSRGPPDERVDAILNSVQTPRRVLVEHNWGACGHGLQGLHQHPRAHH